MSEVAAKSDNQSLKPVMRQATLIVLSQWYENETYLGRMKYAPGKGPKSFKLDDVPEDKLLNEDPLAEAKRDRPWAWTRTFERATGAVDKKGNKVIETLSILDVLGRGPYESPRARGSHEPRGPSGVVTDISQRSDRSSEFIRQRADWFKRVHKGMHHLQVFAPVYSDCVLLSLAGYSRKYIADRINCSASQSQQYYECGMTWLTGCVSENPVWRIDLPEYRALLGQLLDFNVPVMEASDLGLPGSFCSVSNESKRLYRKVWVK